MQCNLQSGTIYKGSIAQVTVQLFPMCYDATAVTDVVLNFYTVSGTSIEFSGDTIVIDGNMGTVVFQVVELEALEDGLLRYNVAYNYNGEPETRDMETRWFIQTPNDYTPIEYVTTDDVEEIVEQAMKDDFVTTTALTDTLQDYVTESALTNTLGDYATQSGVTQELAGKQDTLVSGTSIKTINQESVLGSGDISITPYTGITGNEVTNALGYVPLQPSGATITGIWLGTLEQYNQLESHDPSIIYVIQQ